MTTLDMMNLARTNNKTYRSNDCLYNTKLGFHDKVGCEWDAASFTYLNELFDIDNWEEDNLIYMTKFEAEEKYGIKIVG